MSSGAARGFLTGSLNSFKTPRAVIRPILPLFVSVNQILLSGPLTILIAPALGALIENCLNTPCGVTLPILFAVLSMNHKLPSGPLVMPANPALAVGTVNSRRSPASVIRPILLLPNSVNHMAPSGPTVMSTGPAVWMFAGLGMLKRVSIPVGVNLTIALDAGSVIQILPSGPAATPMGSAGRVGPLSAKNLASPADKVYRPMRGSPKKSVNHSVPPGPIAMLLTNMNAPTGTKVNVTEGAGAAPKARPRVAAKEALR